MLVGANDHKANLKYYNILFDIYDKGGREGKKHFYKLIHNTYQCMNGIKLRNGDEANLIHITCLSLTNSINKTTEENYCILESLCGFSILSFDYTISNKYSNTIAFVKYPNQFQKQASCSS